MEFQGHHTVLRSGRGRPRVKMGGIRAFAPGVRWGTRRQPTVLEDDDSVIRSSAVT